MLGTGLAVGIRSGSVFSLPSFVGLCRKMGIVRVLSLEGEASPGIGECLFSSDVEVELASSDIKSFKQ